VFEYNPDCSPGWRFAVSSGDARLVIVTGGSRGIGAESRDRREFAAMRLPSIICWRMRPLIRPGQFWRSAGGR
jgi:hypothetical protein